MCASPCIPRASLCIPDAHADEGQKSEQACRQAAWRVKCTSSGNSMSSCCTRQRRFISAGDTLFVSLSSACTQQPLFRYQMPADWGLQRTRCQCHAVPACKLMGCARFKRWKPAAHARLMYPKSRTIRWARCVAISPVLVQYPRLLGTMMRHEQYRVYHAPVKQAASVSHGSHIPLLTFRGLRDSLIPLVPLRIPHVIVIIPRICLLVQDPGCLVLRGASGEPPLPGLAGLSLCHLLHSHSCPVKHGPSHETHTVH